MAEVWRAIDHGKRPFSPDRQVALKILKPEVAEDPSAVTRFDREGREMIKFDHPNIAKVFDRKQDGDVHFLVMELIEGRSVAKLLKDRGRPLPPDDAVAIISQVCQALEYAHDNGVIHRDIKPLNVMIEGDFEEGVTPTVKVTDFGIALAKQATRLTQTNGVVGTPAYMPAEVARGGGATESSDVYACGAMLYELLTGSVPFGGQTLAHLLAEQEAGPPPSPDARNPSVPKELSDAILVAIALDPTWRFENAGTMRGAIEAALTGASLSDFLPTRLIEHKSSATPRTLYRAKPPRKRTPSVYAPQNPWAALLTYIVVLSVLVVLLEIALRLTSAIAATPTWALALAVVVGVTAFALRRSPLFSADDQRRDAARARLRHSTRVRFRGLLVIGLGVLWAVLGYYLATAVKMRIDQQPGPSHLYLEIGAAAVWLAALAPLFRFARSQRTVGRTAGGGVLLAFFWVIGALALTEAPGALGPFWARPPMARQVRAEAKQWIVTLRHPDSRLSRSEVGTLRRQLAHSRNAVLRALRHADGKAQRRQFKRRARRWMRSMRRGRRVWAQPRCQTEAAQLVIGRHGVLAICP